MKKIIVFIIMAIMSFNVANAQIVANTTVSNNDEFTIVDKYNTSALSSYGYMDIIKESATGIYTLRFCSENQFCDKYVMFQLGEKKVAIETLKQFMVILENTASKKNGPTTFQDAAGHTITTYKRQGAYYLNEVGVPKSHTGYCTGAISINDIKKITIKLECNNY